jgi:hypothetical protein
LVKRRKLEIMKVGGVETMGPVQVGKRYAKNLNAENMI